VGVAWPREASGRLIAMGHPARSDRSDGMAQGAVRSLLQRISSAQDAA
jgi:hypothetical protein